MLKARKVPIATLYEVAAVLVAKTFQGFLFLIVDWLLPFPTPSIDWWPLMSYSWLFITRLVHSLGGKALHTFYSLSIYNILAFSLEGTLTQLSPFYLPQNSAVLFSCHKNTLKAEISRLVPNLKFVFWAISFVCGWLQGIIENILRYMHTIHWGRRRLGLLHASCAVIAWGLTPFSMASCCKGRRGNRLEWPS